MIWLNPILMIFGHSNFLQASTKEHAHGDHTEWLSWGYTDWNKQEGTISFHSGDTTRVMRFTYDKIVFAKNHLIKPLMVALTLGFVGNIKETNNHFLARVYLPTHYSIPSHVNSLDQCLWNLVYLSIMLTQNRKITVDFWKIG